MFRFVHFVRDQLTPLIVPALVDFIKASIEFLGRCQVREYGGNVLTREETFTGQPRRALNINVRMFCGPAYRDAFKRRHCLVLTDGWYEWMDAPGGKQPYFIRRKDAQPFAFAGLWERWTDPVDGTPLESCTIVTTDAADSIKDIHPRMPLRCPMHGTSG